MNRVICCYPDAPRLMTVAAEQTARVLLVSFPRERLLVRLWTRLLNAWMALRRLEFRTYVHSEKTIERVAGGHGLRVGAEHRGRIWRAVAFTRD